MQGIMIGGNYPTSKKAVKEAVNATPEKVVAEATSMFGDEFNGHIINLPTGKEIHFVGPDPHTNRRFYGTIKRVNGKLTVS